MGRTGKAAAFFDLDRTLLRGASGPVLSDALQRAGLVPQRSVPGLDLFYRSYNLFGESLAGMALARSTVLALRGVSRERVRAAALDATPQLEELVAPYAPSLLDEHRQAGRALVLATTTPVDLIEPLADRLGLDDVIGTRYAEHDGRYTGHLDGAFVWAAGKLTAVRRWASLQGVDLAESFAYSDSIYDVPLLSSVGHPAAVNPDPRLAAVAALRRWPQLHLDAPPGVPKLFGLEPFDLARATFRPEFFPYARFDIAGLERVPRRGPAIVVANHRSYFDVAALGLTVMRAGRRPRALGKKELFDAPVIGQAARLFGQIMVDRDAGGGDALAAAVRALRGGELVVVLPQGTIPRGAAFSSPRLTGKTGAARLAAATRAPVIPVGLWRTERVWPRSARLPNVTNLLHPPTVRIRVGQPVDGLTFTEPAADTETIMAAIVDLLPPEARVAREPTAEEIARATPPGG
ncbi:MAG TPA: HAD-IB family hydrolase [Acidimicrobiales bacterium]|nr:HAD-IB family hydrolase [Acidimicrobiales bacterium]